MRHLPFLTLLSACFFACNTVDFRPLEDYEFETTTWQLSSIQTWNDTGPPVTRTVESERTLQFWNGTVRSNGSFCDPTGAVGPVEELAYNPIYQEITYRGCNEEGQVEYRGYEVDNDKGELRITFSYLLVGDIYIYEIVE